MFTTTGCSAINKTPFKNSNNLNSTKNKLLTIIKNNNKTTEQIFNNILNFLDSNKDLSDHITQSITTLLLNQLIEKNNPIKQTIADYSSMMQTFFSLFIPSHKDEETNKQINLIITAFKKINQNVIFNKNSKFFDYKIENQLDYFYSLKEYLPNNKIDQNEKNDLNEKRIYIKCFHPFYDLFLINDITNNKVPFLIEGLEINNNTIKLKDFLHYSLITNFLSKTQFNLREKVNANPDKKIHNANFELKNTNLSKFDFQQPKGWIAACDVFKKKKESPFSQKFIEKFTEKSFIAGASGTLLKLTINYILLSNMQSTYDNEKLLTKFELLKNIDLLSHGIFAWIVAGKDHSAEEIIFAYHYLQLYLKDYFNESDFQLKQISDNAVDEIIEAILNKKNFYSDFFKTINFTPGEYGQIIDNIRGSLQEAY